jgi:hypothetical protein
MIPPFLRPGGDLIVACSGFLVYRNLKTASFSVTFPRKRGQSSLKRLCHKFFPSYDCGKQRVEQDVQEEYFVIA